jgi:TRAP-type uncharacterized transport system fused permease subunit
MHGSRTTSRVDRCVDRWRRVLDGARDAGMSTAEYAVGTLAAVAFAGVLLKVVTSPGIQSALSAIISKALK